MKIAFVYDVIYPYVKGGAERRYYELSKRLSLRHEVHLFGMKFWEGDDVLQRDDGVFLHGVCPPKELYINGRRSIYQAIYYAVKLVFPLLKEDFDLIECPSAPYFQIFTCWLYSILKKRKFVVVWLEYWGNLWYEYMGHLGFWGKLVERLATRIPDHIIAISDHTKESLVRHGVSADLISTVPLGIDLAEINAVKPSNFQSDLIFVGRLIKEKQIDTLIFVVKELIQRGLDVNCCIIGDGPERTELQVLCNNIGIESNASFLGSLFHEEVYALMKSSRVFTFLSTREGFGIVVPEANACGLPAIVVKSEHNAATSLVKHEKNGFVCDLNVNEITDKVFKLLTDDEMWLSMQRTAKNWARQFDWDMTTEKAEQVYRQLTGS